jgi:hypothetical protein
LGVVAGASRLLTPEGAVDRELVLAVEPPEEPQP